MSGGRGRRYPGPAARDSPRCNWPREQGIEFATSVNFGLIPDRLMGGIRRCLRNSNIGSTSRLKTRTWVEATQPRENYCVIITPGRTWPADGGVARLLLHTDYLTRCQVE